MKKEINIKSARLTVFDLPTITKGEKKRLIKWLRDTADEIEKETDHKIWVKNPRWTLFKKAIIETI